jgi:hypothetical protein
MEWLDKFKKMNIEKITLSDAIAIITILFINFSHDENAYNILAEYTKSLIKERPHGHLQTPTSTIKYWLLFFILVCDVVSFLTT